MRHIIFTENTYYNTAILIKDSAFKRQELIDQYLNKTSMPLDSVVGFNLQYEGKKAPVKLIKAHMSNVLKACNKLGVQTLYVCDANYFKVLVGEKKAEAHYGYIKDCAIKGFEHMKVILGANYQALFYNPQVSEKIDLSLKTLDAHISGLHIEPGSNIIHSAGYPCDYHSIMWELKQLHQYPELTFDIEAFSLNFFEAGIGTVAFAWDEHNGISFPCDYRVIPEETIDNVTYYGEYRKNNCVRELLLKFLLTYKGKLTYHNANYDVKVLIFVLFMEEDFFNQKGLIKGLEVMTKLFDDTKLIAYLATNSTARTSLSLKDLAQSFAGNYAETDIKDIRRIPRDKLLAYNLVDCLSTWFVKKKYEPVMLADDQLSVYETVMRPSIKVILQMELTGMPLDLATVKQTKRRLQAVYDTQNSVLFNHPIIVNFTEQMRKEAWTEKNLLLKKKVKPLSDFDDVVYNPNSNQQTGRLLHDILGLPIADLTPEGQPSVGNSSLEKILVSTQDPDHIAILKSLMGIGEVSIILNTFVNTFLEKSIIKSDGMNYLHGNFNIGGTVSGRLSSSKPNMQNIPSTGSVYAKDIKKCFQAPKGWLLAGADFSSLEDRISALTTRDPNKMKVYIDGYDGHCLRAHTYFGDQMTGIDPNSVASINSIKHKYPELRQRSKAPTFLLTYGGTHHGLVAQVGLDIIEAKQIEDQYHVLYQASDEWVQDKLIQATQDGYVTVAFGLRVRTPILGKTLLNKKSTPYEAKAEGRTAGNALGQSYGLLNNRASIEFQERTLNSPYALDIKPIAQIHDSMYFLIRDTYACVEWFNNNLVECMEWQGLPEINHPIVKLGGGVEIFWPSWAETMEIPNGASQQQIAAAVKAFTA